MGADEEGGVCIIRKVSHSYILQRDVGPSLPKWKLHVYEQKPLNISCLLASRLSLNYMSFPTTPIFLVERKRITGFGRSSLLF